ncbi:MAG: hypothetical protein WEB09_10510 [Nitriliruptor sp.]
MDPLHRHLRAVRRAAGISSRTAALDEGVHPTSWNRHVVRHRWARPYEGVAIAPWADDEDQTAVAAVAVAHGGAACGETARWLHGHGRRPRELEVAIPHARSVRRVSPDPPPRRRAADPAATTNAGGAGGAPGPGHAGDDPLGGPADVEATRAERAAAAADEEARRWHARCRKVRVRRCRWLAPSDVVLLRGVPVLAPVATTLSLAAGAPDHVRGFLVDARHAGQLELAAVRERLAEVRSLRGRHVLVATLEALEDRHLESVFHDRVLAEVERRGYGPSLAPVVLDTPHGRPVQPDVALVAWQVALELDGDRFHRDRDARRRERERLSAYASSGWVVLIVDHRTWTEQRERVFADLDGAILAQRGSGRGRNALLPPHLRTRSGR